MSAAELQILAYAGTSNQLESFRSRRFRLRHCLVAFQSLLKVHEDGVLMSRDHNVDIIRIHHTEAYGRHTELRLSQKHVVEKVRKSQAVKSGGNTELQTVCVHIHRIGIQVGGTFHNAVEHFALGSAGKDSQFFPLLEAGSVRELLHQFHFHIFRLVQVVQHFLSNLLRLLIFILCLDPENFRQVIQRVLALDLSFCLSGLQHIKRRVLHDMDITAGSGRHCS